MAQRKLASGAHPLHELVAQTVNRTHTIGKNLLLWYDCSLANNWTTDQAFIKRFAQELQKKGISNYDGSRIEITLGALSRGEKLPNPIPGKKVRERIGTSHFSGKELARGYPISYTLYDGNGEILARAGYTQGTRLTSENLIGPDHADLATIFIPRLSRPDFRELLEERLTHSERERQKEGQKKLENPLARMPEAYRKMLEESGISVAELQQTPLFECGEHLMNEQWSAMLLALDPGKNRNLHNWFRSHYASGEMPQEVREAWVYVHRFPHRDDVKEMLKLLGEYQLQNKPELRKGIAGAIPEEIRWLASDAKDAKKAHKLYQERYGKSIDLEQEHKPAVFYKGKSPPHPATIGKLLTEPVWTVADREGLLRALPITEFRQEYNQSILYRYFRDAQGFSNARGTLAVKGSKLSKSDQTFVQHIFNRIKLGTLDGYGDTGNLLRRTSIHNAITEYDKLCVLTTLARRA